MYKLNILSGAVVGLMNTTDYGNEGDKINICVELVSIEELFRRQLSVALEIFNGTADCMMQSLSISQWSSHQSYSFIHVLYHFQMALISTSLLHQVN